jgi:hypothetical protein
MYNRAVTAQQLDEHEKAHGWRPVPHSPRQIANATAHFDSLIHPETGDLSRPLDKDEQRFIRNERRLCALDFRYWFNYARIIDWQKKDVPFQPNVAQKIVLSIWGDLERRGRAIMMLQLKARQLPA